MSAYQQQLKILADPKRFLILQHLACCQRVVSCCEKISGEEHGCCVADLVQATDLSQPTVSHHLKTLSDVGLVLREKRGTYACYFANPRAIEALAAWLQRELIPPDCI